MRPNARMPKVAGAMGGMGGLGWLTSAASTTTVFSSKLVASSARRADRFGVSGNNLVSGYRSPESIRTRCIQIILAKSAGQPLPYPNV